MPSPFSLPLISPVLYQPSLSFCITKYRVALHSHVPVVQLLVQHSRAADDTELVVPVSQTAKHLPERCGAMRRGEVR